MAREDGRFKLETILAEASAELDYTVPNWVKRTLIDACLGLLESYYTDGYDNGWAHGTGIEV